MGFTVIELMIVVVIIAILVALAYPSYSNYARKAKRGEAQQLLMNWSINQEIFRSNNTPYAADDSAALPKPQHQDGLFLFSAHDAMGDPPVCPDGASGNPPSATTYWLLAEAQGDQANDEARSGQSCASLCLSSAGQKIPAECWE